MMVLLQALPGSRELRPLADEHPSPAPSGRDACGIAACTHRTGCGQIPCHVRAGAYEFEKARFVTFTRDELEVLEEGSSGAIEIAEQASRLARRAYEHAIALDAQLEEAYRLLALMLIDRGDTQAAIRLANALRRMQPSREPQPPSA